MKGPSVPGCGETAGSGGPLEGIPKPADDLRLLDVVGVVDLAVERCGMRDLLEPVGVDLATEHDRQDDFGIRMV